MFKLEGTLTLTRSCPECGWPMTKSSQEDVTCENCKWVWKEPKIVQISAGIQGKASL